MKSRVLTIAFGFVIFILLIGCQTTSVNSQNTKVIKTKKTKIINSNNNESASSKQNNNDKNNTINQQALYNLPGEVPKKSKKFNMVIDSSDKDSSWKLSNQFKLALYDQFKTIGENSPEVIEPQVNGSSLVYGPIPSVSYSNLSLYSIGSKKSDYGADNVMVLYSNSVLESKKQIMFTMDHRMGGFIPVVLNEKGRTVELGKTFEPLIFNNFYILTLDKWNTLAEKTQEKTIRLYKFKITTIR
jgi:hypothetical protein